MDGTSPGNMPTSLGGEVWVGETRWDFAGFRTGSLRTLPGDTAPYVAPQPHTHYHFAPAAPLSDADVERIARRVAELLREAKP